MALAYEFVGSQVKQFRILQLPNSNGALKIDKYMIDPYYNPYLVVIVWVLSPDGSYTFTKLSFANYAATVRVKLP